MESKIDDLSTKTDEQLVQLLKSEGFFKSIPKDRELKIELLKNLKKTSFIEILNNSKENELNKKTLIVSNVEFPNLKTDSDVIGIIDNKMSDKIGMYELVAENKDETIKCYNDNNISICASPDKIDMFIKNVNQKNLTDFYISEEEEEKKPIKDIVNNINVLSDLYSELDMLLDDLTNLKTINDDSSKTKEVSKNIDKIVKDSNTKNIDISELLLDLDTLLNDDNFDKKILPKIEKTVEYIDDKGKLDNSLFVNTETVEKELLESTISDIFDEKISDKKLIDEIILDDDYDDKKKTTVEISLSPTSKGPISNTSLQNILKVDALTNFDTYSDTLLTNTLNKEFFIPSIITNNITIDTKKTLLQNIINNNTINLLDNNKYKSDTKDIIFVLYDNIGVYITIELYNKLAKINNLSKEFSIININNKLIFGTKSLIDNLVKNIKISNIYVGTIKNKTFSSIEVKQNLNSLINLLIEQKIQKFINLLNLDTEIRKLNKIIDSKNLYTIFVPIDDAYNKLTDKELLTSLFIDKDIQKLFLYYHIVENNYKNINLLADERREETIKLKTLNKQIINVTREDGNILLNKKVKIIKSDIDFNSNITIHIIDNLLIPSDNKEKIKDKPSIEISKDSSKKEELETEIKNLLDSFDDKKPKISNVTNTNISNESGLVYNKQQLLKKTNNELNELLKNYGVIQNFPTIKEKKIKLILDAQKNKCNINTACEISDDVCNVNYNSKEGICTNLSDIDLETFYYIKHKDKIFVAGKKTLNKFMKENNISETIISIKKYPKLISTLKVELTETLKEEEIFEISKDELVNELLETINDTKLTDTSLVSLKISPIKSEKDITTILSDIDFNFIDLDPEKINIKSKQQIARCLGLLP